jgi:hypothetical protein
VVEVKLFLFYRNKIRLCEEFFKDLKIKRPALGTGPGLNIISGE